MNGGWRVGRSIALELDFGLTLASGYLSESGVLEEYAGLVGPIDETWRSELTEILGPHPRSVSLLDLASWCVGTTYKEDYARALLPIRSLDADAARASLSAQLGRPEIAALPLPEAFSQVQREAYEAVGLDVANAMGELGKVSEEARLLERVLVGGDLHEKFWHLLDRFTYEWYLPWVRTREELMRAATRLATMSLGTATAESGTPRLEWLPAQNPLRTYPEIKKAILERGLAVYFWVEPFGLADSSAIRTDSICIPFGEPGPIYARFRQFADTVAARAKALGDPTRLLILRLIRNFPLMNTELAEFLEIARPTASIHARILRDAGLITSYRDGHAVRHEINREELRALFDDLYRLLDLDPGE